MLEQLVKNCSLWKGLMLQSSIKDCILWVGFPPRAEEEHEEQGEAETKHYEVIPTPSPHLPAPLRGNRRECVRN